MSPLVSPDLLAIMQCPACAGALQEHQEPESLRCADCGLRYPVVEGVPNMIVDEALPPTPAS